MSAWLSIVWMCFANNWKCNLLCIHNYTYQACKMVVFWYEKNSFLVLFKEMFLYLFSVYFIISKHVIVSVAKLSRFVLNILFCLNICKINLFIVHRFLIRLEWIYLFAFCLYLYNYILQLCKRKCYLKIFELVACCGRKILWSSV